MEPSSRRLHRLFAGRPLEKLHQRGTVLFRADALLRHLGARRVSRGSDVEQSCNCLRRPDDIETLERIGKIVARRGGDAPAENARERRACPVGLLGAQQLVVVEKDLNGKVTTKEIVPVLFSVLEESDESSIRAS